jgi:hypothetical protein
MRAAHIIEPAIKNINIIDSSNLKICTVKAAKKYKAYRFNTKNRNPARYILVCLPFISFLGFGSIKRLPDCSILFNDKERIKRRGKNEKPTRSFEVPITSFFIAYRKEVIAVINTTTEIIFTMFLKILLRIFMVFCLNICTKITKKS